VQLADSHVGKLGGEPPEPGDDLLLVIRFPDLSHLVVIEASRFDRGLPAPEISVRRGGKPHIDPRVRDRLSGSMKRVDLIDDSRGIPRLRLTWFHHGLRNTGERARPHDAADVIRDRSHEVAPADFFEVAISNRDAICRKLADRGEDRLGGPLCRTNGARDVRDGARPLQVAEVPPERQQERIRQLRRT